MKVKAVVFALVVLVVIGCASTSFKSTWKSPEANQIQITGKKVVVVATNVQKSVRYGIEESVAAELNKLGAQAVASHTLLADDATIASAKTKLAAEGYDAA